MLLRHEFKRLAVSRASQHFDYFYAAHADTLDRL